MLLFVMHYCLALYDTVFLIQCSSSWSMHMYVCSRRCVRSSDTELLGTCCNFYLKMPAVKAYTWHYLSLPLAFPSNQSAWRWRRRRRWVREGLLSWDRKSHPPVQNLSTTRLDVVYLIDPTARLSCTHPTKPGVSLTTGLDAPRRL